MGKRRCFKAFLSSLLVCPERALNGQGKTGLSLKLAIVKTITGITLAVLLVPAFGVIGLIITTILDAIPATIISLHWIKRHYDASVDWVSSVKILRARQ